MDPSIRPQDDFYRHINGAWLANHEIPADRASDGAFYALRDLSEKNCRRIIEDAAGGKLSDPDAVRIATIYDQFMDEAKINELGPRPLEPFLAPIFAATTREDLARVTGTLSRLGISSFFNEGVSPDLNDSSRYILYVNQAGLGLPDESYYREEKYADIRAKYLEYMRQIFALANVAPSGEEADAAEKVFDLETDLASHHWDVVKDREVDQQNNPRTWAELAEGNPGFAWEEWARALRLDPDSVPVFNVNQPDYLEAGAKIWADTPLAVLKLWLARKVIRFASPFLSDFFVMENFDFYSRTLAGVEEMRPRWKRGVGLVEALVGEAVGRLYVEKHFPPDYKERMDLLVADLISAYRESISALDWMSPETKERALEKLASFNPKIGYPEKWRDYSDLQVTSSNTLLENIAAASEFEADFELARLGKEVDRDEWFMTPQTVNAYYNPLMNEIVFPAAILQPPFFNPQADEAVNFAAIGAVIGHEIGHGFDDQGSQFDAAGEMKNWWTDADRTEFEARTAALIDQYDAYSPADLGEEHRVNGALTVGENIGDLGGLTIAWKAWQNALSREGLTPETAPEIDGVNAKERFFASWARIWRGKYRDEYAIQLLAVDPHSPAEFRCNGVLANFDEFANHYELTEGDALWTPPENRVKIW